MRLAVNTGGWSESRQINADPDSDVRASAAQPRRGPHGARPPQVARSLLSLKIVPLVLLTLVSSMSACVVPVAPNFQDPPGGLPNIAPYLLSVVPDLGTFVPVITQDFQVTVTDQNVGDDLYYVWAIDYPPFNNAVTRTSPGKVLHLQTGVQLSAPLSLAVTCALAPVPTIAVHRLEFIVADRPLDPSMPNNRLDQVVQGSGGLVAYADWKFQITCP